MHYILESLHTGDHPPVLVTHFDSEIEQLLTQAWAEQRQIGWDQFLNGRLSCKWGDAQTVYYQKNIITRDNLVYSKSIWMTTTIKSLLDYTLNLWADRYRILHGFTK